MKIISINGDLTNEATEVAFNVDQPLPAEVMHLCSTGQFGVFLRGTVLHVTVPQGAGYIGKSVIEMLNNAFDDAERNYRQNQQNEIRLRDEMLAILVKQTGLPLNPNTNLSRLL